ncbi:hypothetical protein E1B28_011662 [Marasmius oreades]|uniref:Uncharacterized protein n=1 Tax=Marasmius oreades TaxID=181124 RepID=A0A9P7RVZ0_9AGAR|nr:uncharacterized protein E1B28_011662 [Marasmius oreades]KAG7090043.1 hypothetical protein E1B28_011662 [Marasmius oreades]
MTRSENYTGKEAQQYDREAGHGSLVTCNNNVESERQGSTVSETPSPSLNSTGSCCSRTPALSSKDWGVSPLSFGSDSPGSSPARLLRNASGSRSMNHDDDDLLHDSGKGVSGANLQKSIRVPAPSTQPFARESKENLMTRPISSMKNTTKLTKRPSLSLSTNNFTVLSDANNSPPSISIASPSPTYSPCKQSTLKRKDNMNVFRRSAPMPVIDDPLFLPTSQVTPRPHSQPALISLPSPSPSSPTHKRNSSSTSIPITSFQAHARSYSQPNSVRLGHPNRPYYSAIRKDMSSPDTTTLAYTRSASPPSSFSFPRNARLSSQSQSVQDPEDLVSTFVNSPSSVCAGVGTETTTAVRKHNERHQSAPALSRKEEMELRLALARNVRGPTEDTDVGRQPGATDTLKRKMEKFRKGFKDMWRCRS